VTDVTTNHGTRISKECKYGLYSKVEWHSFLPPSSASTRPAVLAFLPAAAVCAPAVLEVALDARVYAQAPP